MTGTPAPRPVSKPLGHVIGIPRAPVGLAEDQVIILPRLAGPEPRSELDLAVLAQLLRGLGVEEHRAVPGPALGP
jgi:hypothetical protein